MSDFSEKRKYSFTDIDLPGNLFDNTMIFSLKRTIANSIDTITSEQFPGRIGLVACPGVRIGAARSKKVAKYVKADIQGIVDWGAKGVISLVEEHELSIAGVKDLPERLESVGIWWRHMPIMDMYIPEEDFEQEWVREGARVKNLLSHGDDIVIHCYAGLGRTGLVAARILVDFGIKPQDAITSIRASNKRRIQTKEQAEYIRAL